MITHKHTLSIILVQRNAHSTVSTRVPKLKQWVIGIRLIQVYVLQCGKFHSLTHFCFLFLFCFSTHGVLILDEFIGLKEFCLQRIMAYKFCLQRDVTVNAFGLLQI